MSELFSGVVQIRPDASKQVTIKLDANRAELIAGADGNEGDLIVKDGNNREVFRVNGSAASLRLGTNGNDGDISIRDGANREVFDFDANLAELTIGAAGNAGDIIVKDGENRETIRTWGDAALIDVGTTGSAGNIRIKNGNNRDALLIYGSWAEAGEPLETKLKVGTEDTPGVIFVCDERNLETIRLYGAEGKLVLGRSEVGGTPQKIILDGGTGDINCNRVITPGADAAEQFDLAESAEVTPGMLMVLNEKGQLEPASIPYDTKVVGVVAGAGNRHPGIVLDKRNGDASRVVISMLGKVSCMADAAHGPIEVGDLLTTSPTLGHAMRASDYKRAFGSTIGKALNPLRKGVGLIDALVALK